MGLKNCDIKLDNPYNTYYAGQTLNGTVHFKFDSPKKVRGIIIRFLGEAHTERTEVRKISTNDGKTEDETVTLEGHEEYFRIQYYLLGSKNASEIELSAGDHEYPFTCALPPVLPSSFEGEFGHVRYTIKVTLDRPWRFDQDAKMAFTVLTPVDLNSNPRVKEPFKLELEKSFCCLCCRSGPMTIVTLIPKTGYVSGELIPITCECDNASNVSINSLAFALIKRVTYRTTRPQSEKKEVNEKIVETKLNEFNPNESKTVSVQLQIPPLPPSNLNCGIISLDYFVQFECIVDGPHQNLKGMIPITIGTVPLLDEKNIQQPMAAQNFADNMGGALGWNVPYNAQSSLLPGRPDFNESQFKCNTITDKTDSQDTIIIGGNNFSPRYPTLPAPSAPPYMGN